MGRLRSDELADVLAEVVEGRNERSERGDCERVSLAGGTGGRSRDGLGAVARPASSTPPFGGKRSGVEKEGKGSPSSSALLPTPSPRMLGPTRGSASAFSFQAPSSFPTLKSSSEAAGARPRERMSSLCLRETAM